MRPPELPYTENFVTESAFRHLVAHHLHLIEPGLKPYLSILECQEFPCSIKGRGRHGVIDILAVDKDGAFVVIECKVALATARVLGQILGYLAWIKEHKEERGCNVRGVIVAVEIHPLLVLALRFIKALPVTILQYERNGPWRRIV